MNNPYASAMAPVAEPRPKSQIAFDIGLLALFVMVWLVVTYAVLLPSSKLLTKDVALMAMSPFIPIGLLAMAIAGQTIWAVLITIIVCPITVSLVVGALGVRTKRAWVAAISMGILYGLFLRVFYLMCDVS